MAHDTEYIKCKLIVNDVHLKSFELTALRRMVSKLPGDPIIDVQKNAIIAWLDKAQPELTQLAQDLDDAAQTLP